jgi:hypothetical protein
MKMSQSFETYEELVEFLRSWRSWHEAAEYDFGGAVHLLGACLSNILDNALDAEIEDLPDYLEPSQQELLMRLASVLGQDGE